MKESHADALKLEGGEEIIGTVKRILIIIRCILLNTM